MEKLLHMEERLHQRVVGRMKLFRLFRTPYAARAALQDPNRPIGSFIFLGPTGVGKTELARALAEFLFDDENAMIRIDMSEYQDGIPSADCLALRRAMSAMRKAGNSQKLSAAGRIAWSCSMKLKKHIQKSSMHYCKCWMMGA